MSKTHKLKTWPEPFANVWVDIKRFEVRKNDRNFQPGDRLILQRYDPETDNYSGEEIKAHVNYILAGGQFGIEEGFCVMDIDIENLSSYPFEFSTKCTST